MADSETSRILLKMTRRNLLSGAMTSASGLASKPAFSMVFTSPVRKPSDDPAVLVGGEWAAAHERYVDLVHRRWDLGNELVRAIPNSEIEIRLDGKVLFASTKKEVEDHMDGRSGMAVVREKASGELAALDLTWNDADERIGYSRTIETESETYDLRSKLAESVWNIPAKSVAGAAARLRCFIEMNTPIAPWRKHLHPTLRRIQEEPSFPDLRSILADLDRIAEAGNA